MFYVADNFRQAVVALVGPGSIKNRLASAYLQNLEALEEDQVPEIIRADFLQLRNAMHAIEPLAHEDSVQATVRKLSFDDADSLAGRIVSMYDTVLRNPNPPAVNGKPKKRVNGKKKPKPPGNGHKVESGIELSAHTPASVPPYLRPTTN